MSDNIYFGQYARFEATSKKDLGILLSADNQIGDIFEVVFIDEEGLRKAWIKNRFGNLVGFFDEQTSRQLSLCQARGWELRSLLSFIAFSESPSPGLCWGEAALICFNNNYSDPFEVFLQGVSTKMANGIRPDIDLGELGVNHVIDSGGTWLPTRTIPLPEKQGGTVIMKSNRELSEKMIDTARSGNKGCLAIGWIFIAVIICVVIAGIFFSLRSCSIL